jgi:hypothetical protein
MSEIKENYKPIDMDDYPYAVGDVLEGNILVVRIVKGTAEDSQDGLVAHKILGYEDDGCTPVLDPKEVIVRDKIDAMDVKKHKGKLHVVGVNPKPQAQMVFYQDHNEKKLNNGHRRIYSMRPDAFLKFIEKNKADIEKAAAKPEKGKK